MERDKEAQRHLRRAFSSLAESSTPQGQLCLDTELTLSLSVTPHREGNGTVSCPSFATLRSAHLQCRAGASQEAWSLGCPSTRTPAGHPCSGPPFLSPPPGQDPELRVSPSAWHRDLPVLTCCLGARGVVSTCKNVPITTTVPYPLAHWNIMTQDRAARAVGTDLRLLSGQREGSGRDQRGQRLPSLHQKQGEEAGESSGDRRTGGQGSSESTRQPAQRGTKISC